jgi:hypothetical protein
VVVPNKNIKSSQKFKRNSGIFQDPIIPTIFVPSPLVKKNLKTALSFSFHIFYRTIKIEFAKQFTKKREVLSHPNSITLHLHSVVRVMKGSSLSAFSR